MNKVDTQVVGPKLKKIELGPPVRAKLSDSQELDQLMIDQAQLYQLIVAGIATPEQIAYYEYCDFRVRGGYRQ